MSHEQTLYEFLEVDRRASPEVLEAAYHRLARKYHPDINRAPDAVRLMQHLNNAYQILRDPAKRAEYDRHIFGAEEQRSSNQSQRQEQEVKPKPIRCENCGRVNGTIRAAVFQYVISVVIMSFKRGGGAGILCGNCRNNRAITYSLLSLVLGPWGFPWGIIWTLEALGINLGGGKQPPDVNGPLLRAQGAHFLSTEDFGGAIEAFEASLTFEENSQVREVLRDLQGHGYRSSREHHSRSLSPAVVVLLSVGLFIAGLYAISTSSKTPATVQTLPTARVQISSLPTNAPVILSTRFTPTDTPRPFASPTPALSRISTEGPMKNGLRIGNLEWNVTGYTLVEYARNLEVQMIFRNANIFGEQLQMDFSLLSDGRETRAISLQLAEIDFTRKVYLNERPSSVGSSYLLGRGEYLLAIVVFATPPSCVTSGDQKDACMRAKDTKVRWSQFNLTETLFQFR